MSPTSAGCFDILLARISDSDSDLLNIVARRLKIKNTNLYTVETVSLWRKGGQFAIRVYFDLGYNALVLLASAVLLRVMVSALTLSHSKNPLRSTALMQ